MNISSLLRLALVATALTGALAGCGSSASTDSGSQSSSDYSNSSSDPAASRTSDAPAEVTSAVLAFGKRMYAQRAQSDPTFTGPSVVDAAYCNSAGQNAYGNPLYECYYTYDNGASETEPKNWSWQGNAGAIPEGGDWN